MEIGYAAEIISLLELCENLLLKICLRQKFRACKPKEVILWAGTAVNRECEFCFDLLKLESSLLEDIMSIASEPCCSLSIFIVLFFFSFLGQIKFQLLFFYCKGIFFIEKYPL